MLNTLCLIMSLQGSLPAPNGDAHLARIDGNLRTLAQLQKLGVDLVERDLPGGHFDLVADDGQLRFLKAQGLDATILIEDIAGYYAQRLATGSTPPQGSGLGSWLQPAFGQGSMGGYYTFAEVESVLDQIGAAYPQYVTPKFSLGQSLEGRDLWAVKVSDQPGVDENEPEVRFDAMHHAREPESMQTALWYLLWLCEECGTDPLATYLVNRRETWILPVVNPDGYVYNQTIQPGGGGMWRKNRRDNGGGSMGVDLNRNYPYEWFFDDSGSSSNPNGETYRGTAAASEPEVAAMVAFMASRDFKTALSMHTYSNLWLAPWGYAPLYPGNWSAYDEIGSLATEFNGYPHDPASLLLYEANGVTFDQDHGAHGTLAWTPEIGNSSDGFWPPVDRIIPLAEENRLALARTALAAGAWLRLGAHNLMDAGDGDGIFEGGESVLFDLVLRNSGLAPTGPVTVTLTSLSPWAVVSTSPGGAANVNSFSDLHQTQMLDLLAGVPAGTLIEYSLEFTWDGHSFSAPDAFVAGAGVPLAVFDFEGASDEGWGLSAPNDASTGTWERGDPVGTAAQPEDNHTPGGTSCWFTGQGVVGGSLGSNDVDGGTTTLTSPNFNLSGQSAVQLNFWLWYSNSTGGSPGQDVFLIEGSDDGGASWTNLATVGPAGANGGWNEYSLDLETSLNMTAAVRLRFMASDLGSGSIVEAALDDVSLVPADPGGLGQRSCSPAVPNSTGNPASLHATGSATVSDQDLQLATINLPHQQFGYYLCSQASAVVPNPGGSMGILCLGGQIGRFTAQVASTGNTGHLAIDVNIAQLPIGAGVAIQPGDSWIFQLWYRDIAPISTSNFSDVITIGFQ
jgi:hypothetical protein